MSSVKRQLYFTFLNLYEFYFRFSLISSAGTSSTVLNRSSGDYWFGLSLKDKSFWFLTIKYNASCGKSVEVLYQVEEFLYIPSLLIVSLSWTGVGFCQVLFLKIRFFCSLSTITPPSFLGEKSYSLKSMIFWKASMSLFLSPEAKDNQITLFIKAAVTSTQALSYDNGCLQNTVGKPSNFIVS